MTIHVGSRGPAPVSGRRVFLAQRSSAQRMCERRFSRAVLCSGEMERLQRFWMAGACKKNDAKGETSKPLGVLNFTSAFILLTAGMMLSAVLLVLEHPADGRHDAVRRVTGPRTSC